MMMVIVIVVMMMMSFCFFLHTAIHLITTTQMIKPKTKSFITREQNTGIDITITHTFQKGAVPSIIPLVVYNSTHSWEELHAGIVD